MGLLIQLDGRVSLLCFTVVSFSFRHRVDVLGGSRGASVGYASGFTVGYAFST